MRFRIVKVKTMTKKIKYTHVIWDWNGTLLDDVNWSVQSINIMLAKRNLPVFDSADAYHRMFGFPVIDYYRRMGFDFDKEPFEELAEEFIGLYHSGEENFVLFPDVKNTLAAIKNFGLRQVILSASKLSNLLLQIKLFNIECYFDEILGMSDIYAASKIDIGKAYMASTDIGKAVLIGDTAHDCEVAEALGADCVLIANGHNSKSALLSCGVPVVDDITEVIKFLKG